MNAPFLSAEGRGGVADFLFHPETPVSEARPSAPRGVVENIEDKVKGGIDPADINEMLAQRGHGEVKAPRRRWTWLGRVREDVMGALQRRLDARTEQVEVLKGRVEKLVAENGRLRELAELRGLGREEYSKEADGWRNSCAALNLELKAKDDACAGLRSAVAMWRNRALFWEGKVGEVRSDLAVWVETAATLFRTSFHWQKRYEVAERDRATLEEKFQLVDAAERCASERVRLLEDDKRALLDEVAVLREQVRLAIAGDGDLNREGAAGAKRRQPEAKSAEDSIDWVGEQQGAESGQEGREFSMHMESEPAQEGGGE